MPKEPKRKKDLDGGARKMQNKVKKKTDEEAREAHYQRLKGETTFLGCKWSTEAEEDMDSTMVETSMWYEPAQLNDTDSLQLSLHTPTITTQYPLMSPAQMNESDLSLLSPRTPIIHGHTVIHTHIQHEQTIQIVTPTPRTNHNSPNRIEIHNDISNFLTPEPLSDKFKDKMK